MDIKQLAEVVVFGIFIAVTLLIFAIWYTPFGYPILRRIPNISTDTLKKLCFVFLGMGIKWEIDAMTASNTVYVVIVTCTILLIFFILVSVDKIQARRKRKEDIRSDTRLKRVVKDGLREYDEEKKQTK